MSWAKLSQRTVTVAVGLVAFVASTVVILNFYHTPKYFEVIDGVLLRPCESDWETSDAIDDPDRSKHQAFFDALTTRNNQYVFIRELRIVNYFCGRAEIRNHPIKGKRKQQTERYVEVTRLDTKKGLITLEFSSLKERTADKPRIMLVINILDGSYPFAASTCDELCVGADGVYQIQITYQEAYAIFDLVKAPILDRIANAHDCTLKRLNAETAWERFWACRP
jgi:hypothetical protein